MKKLLLSLLFTTSIIHFTNAQFSENVGTGTAGSIAAYSGWQNSSGYTFSGTASDIRTTTASSTYSGASGGSNIYLPGNSSAFFTVTSINTLALTDPSISFGLWKSTTASNATELTFEYSINGTIFTPISIPAQSTGTGTAVWRKILLTGLPASTTLTIRFSNTSTTANNVAFRLDDISVNSLTVLPVTLTAFTAKANLQNIDLAWNTASEKDNSYFEVLRSGDGRTFSKIGEVKGAGTSSAAKSYPFTDKDALPGVSYYQLKQVDADGKSSESEVVAVKSNVAASNFRVFANRQEGTVKLTIFAANEGKGSIKIYDLNGRKLTEQQLNLNKGYNNVSVPFNGANGLHVVSLTTASETVTQKFIQ